VVDMKEDPYVSILLSRPFRNIVGAKINVKCEKNSLNFGKEKVEFSATKLNNLFS
jgi:hypothetical protein